MQLLFLANEKLREDQRHECLGAVLRVGCVAGFLFSHVTLHMFSEGLRWLCTC